MPTIHRRTFLKSLGLTALAGAARHATAAAAPARRKPNIVFIITDDQPLDAFGFLRKKALTPHIDRLAAEGIYLSRAYASSSVCTPSRFTCLTGKYASRCQAPRFLRSATPEGHLDVEWNTELSPDRVNLPQVLQKAGYVTGVVGKWHNGGGPGVSKFWRTFDRRNDPSDPKVAAALTQAQESLHAWVRSCGFDYAASMNLGNFGAHPVLALRHHNQEWITLGALDFIDQNKDRPFYLYMATTLLHGPSPLASLKADPRITHAGLLDKPLNVQPSRQDVLQRARKAGVPERLAPATWLDDGIGAVLKKLDDLGIAKNTLVILFDDHGVESAKGSNYEGGVRTPAIVRWKGVLKPGRSDALVQNIDFAPTILAAAGATPPKEMHVDGVDLMGLLTGRTDKIRDSLAFEIGFTRAVCTKRWKYIALRIPPSRQRTREQKLRMLRKYVADKARREGPERVKDFKIDPDAPLSHMGFPGGQSTERGNALKKHRKTYFDADQLYDLDEDPDEQKNLAGDPAYKAKLEEMKALLAKHLADMPGTFGEFKTQ